jgi:hypothetical protein
VEVIIVVLIVVVLAPAAGRLVLAILSRLNPWRGPPRRTERRVKRTRTVTVWKRWHK